MSELLPEPNILPEGKEHRFFGTRFFALLAVLFLVAGTLAPTPASAQSSSDETTFVNLVNQVRASNGLPPLVQNTQLTTLARGWAQAQSDGVCADGAYICHASPISQGVTQDWLKLGENVGTGPDVVAVMDAFVASPGHFRNIVDPAFTHIGVGVVWDGDRLYTTHRFMTLDSSAPATTAPTTAPPATTAPPPTSPPATSAPTTTSVAPATASTPATTPPTVAAPTRSGTLAAPAPTNPADTADAPRAGVVDEGTTSDRSVSVPVDDELGESASTPIAEPNEFSEGQINLDEDRAAVLLAGLEALS